MEEVIWYKTDWFKTVAFIGMILSVVSMIINYRLIKANKSRKLVVDWLLMGYVFPIISTFILYSRIKRENTK